MLAQTVAYVAMDLPVEGQQLLKRGVQLALEVGILVELHPVIGIGAMVCNKTILI